MSEESRLKRAETLAKIFSLLAIPVLLGIVSIAANDKLSERTVGSQYVQLAVDILQKPPGEDDVQLREWAIELLNKNSPVPLTEQAKQELRLGQTITTAFSIMQGAPLFIRPRSDVKLFHNDNFEWARFELETSDKSKNAALEIRTMPNGEGRILISYDAGDDATGDWGFGGVEVLRHFNAPKPEKKSFELRKGEGVYFWNPDYDEEVFIKYNLRLVGA